MAKNADETVAVDTIFLEVHVIIAVVVGYITACAIVYLMKDGNSPKETDKYWFEP